MKRKLLIILPVLFLVALAALLARGLQSDPRRLESVRIGKAAPVITLATLDGQSFDSRSLSGQVWLLNVFASWCSACVIEHPALLQLASLQRIPIVGLAYKDKLEDTRAWLLQRGDPYSSIPVDLDGRIGIEYGVYGVPETFVIDAKGIVRLRHAGPVDQAFFTQLEAILAEQGGGK